MPASPALPCMARYITSQYGPGMLRGMLSEVMHKSDRGARLNGDNGWVGR